jgi:hypothetical protein
LSLTDILSAWHISYPDCFRTVLLLLLLLPLVDGNFFQTFGKCRGTMTAAAAATLQQHHHHLLELSRNHPCSYVVEPSLLYQISIVRSYSCGIAFLFGTCLL